MEQLKIGEESSRVSDNVERLKVNEKSSGVSDNVEQLKIGEEAAGNSDEMEQSKIDEEAAGTSDNAKQLKVNEEESSGVSDEMEQLKVGEEGAGSSNNVEQSKVSEEESSGVSEEMEQLKVGEEASGYSDEIEQSKVGEKAAGVSTEMEQLEINEGDVATASSSSANANVGGATAKAKTEIKIKKMSSKERKYLVYLVLKEAKQFNFSEIVDDRSVEYLVKCLECSVCRKWVKETARMCMSGHLTCDPHARIMGSCPFESPGDIEKGPITEFGVFCGRRFRNTYPVYVRIFYKIVEMLKKTGGDVGKPESKSEKKDMGIRFFGITDEYIKELIEWAKTKVNDI